MADVVPWSQARSLAHAAGGVGLGIEVVTLTASLWRRSANDVHARTALPAFDVSAIDGWAVAGPGPWRVVGSVRAGAPPTTDVTLGQAVEITTGSALPDGVTGVLRLEHGQVTIEGWLEGQVRPGQDVRRAGDELRAGTVVVEAGSRLDPVRVGLVAAAGHDQVSVVGLPGVRVLVLGDELLQVGVAHGGRVRDSLGPQLPGWLDAWGCGLTEVRHVADDAAAQRAAVRSRADGADVIVTTGGTSVGPADYVRDSVALSAGELVVAGVDCRPGHPMLLAGWSDRWLVGLPGNPLAAVAALLTLLDSLLLGLQGVALAPLRLAELTEPVSSRGGGTRLVPCRFDSGSLVPARGIGSGMLSGLAEADGLAVVAVSAEPGDVVGWLPLPWRDLTGGGRSDQSRRT